jgi:hypothetical protein
MTVYRRDFLIGGLGALAAGSAWPAVAQDSPPDEGRDLLSATTDSGGRMTTPVAINGVSGFAFAVDCAANASVIASDIAGALALPSAGEVEMHSLVARERVPAVSARTLATGAIRVDSPRLVVGSRLGLAGVDGLLGSDVLADARIIMKFKTGRELSIGRSRTDSNGLFTAARRRIRFEALAERQFGALLTIDARSQGIPARVILDSGSQVTVINQRLADETGARVLTLPDGSTTRLIMSPTGRSAPASIAILPNLQFGGIGVSNLPVLVGDFHTFDLLGLRSYPTVLLGVDVLSRFASVVIDIRRSELILER